MYIEDGMKSLMNLRALLHSLDIHVPRTSYTSIDLYARHHLPEYKRTQGKGFSL